MNNIFESLTLEEVELIENLLDTSIDNAFDDGRPKAKALRILTWVLGKRTNPELKMEDLKGITLADAMQSLKDETTKKD